jgi:hypothetical protein
MARAVPHRPGGVRGRTAGVGRWGADVGRRRDLAGVRTAIVRDDLFTDEAGWPSAGNAGADAGDDDGDYEGDDTEICSFLLCCDRSAGRHLYEQLLEAGRARGIEEEGFALHRARRTDL